MTTQEESDEECLDDPIQLVDYNKIGLENQQIHEEKKIIDLTESDDEEIIEVISHLPQRTVSCDLPVTFFDIYRNVKLLQDCRLFSIEVVDCKKHPWFYIKNKHYNISVKDGEHNNKTTKLTDEGSMKVNDTMTEDKARPKIRPVVTPYQMLKVDSKVVSDASKTNINQTVLGHKKADVVSRVDFKKNKGLKGLTIMQMNEVYFETLKSQAEKPVKNKRISNNNEFNKAFKSLPMREIISTTLIPSTQKTETEKQISNENISDKAPKSSQINSIHSATPESQTKKTVVTKKKPNEIISNNAPKSLQINDIVNSPTLECQTEKSVLAKQILNEIIISDKTPTTSQMNNINSATPESQTVETVVTKNKSNEIISKKAPKSSQMNDIHSVTPASQTEKTTVVTKKKTHEMISNKTPKSSQMNDIIDCPTLVSPLEKSVLAKQILNDIIISDQTPKSPLINTKTVNLEDCINTIIENNIKKNLNVITGGHLKPGERCDSLQYISYKKRTKKSEFFPVIHKLKDTNEMTETQYQNISNIQGLPIIPQQNNSNTESIARTLVSMAELVKGKKHTTKSKPDNKMKLNKKDNSILRTKKKKIVSNIDTTKKNKNNIEVSNESISTGLIGQKITISNKYDIETLKRQNLNQCTNTICDGMTNYKNNIKNATSKPEQVEKAKKRNKKQPKAKTFVNPKNVKLMSNKTLVVNNNDDSSIYEKINNKVKSTKYKVKQGVIHVEASCLPSEQLDPSPTVGHSQLGSFFVIKHTNGNESNIQQNETQLSSSQVLNYQRNVMCTLSDQTPPTSSGVQARSIVAKDNIVCNKVNTSGVNTVPISTQSVYQKDSETLFRMPLYMTPNILNLSKPMPQSTILNKISTNQQNARHLESNNNISYLNLNTDCNTVSSSVGARGCAHLGLAPGMKHQTYGQQMQHIPVNRNAMESNKLPLTNNCAMPCLTSVVPSNISANYQKMCQSFPIETVVRNRQDIYYNKCQIPNQKSELTAIESMQNIHNFYRNPNVNCSPVYGRMPPRNSTAIRYCRSQLFTSPLPSLSPQWPRTQNNQALPPPPLQWSQTQNNQALPPPPPQWPQTQNNQALPPPPPQWPQTPNNQALPPPPPQWPQTHNQPRSPLPPQWQHSPNNQPLDFTSIPPVLNNIESSSIIGQNFSGPIRKINIHAVPKSINNSNYSDRLKNSTSVIVSPATSGTLANSKKEMLEELRKGVSIGSPLHSPVKDLKRPLLETDTLPKATTPLARGPSSKKSKLDTSIKKLEQGPVNGYSPPILPIPTYEKTLEMIAKAHQVDPRKPLNIGTETQIGLREFRRPQCLKVESRKNVLDDNQDKSVKKISLTEYMKRVDMPDDNKLLGQNRAGKMESRSESLDSDLGYDSDCTMKL